uniref:Uncharacterized protein n=1 Tax=Tanacetum cinerariifolium TaxID=118510 RepID=A0A6L2MVH1_TANCI|nr:hypothetical protein [Tanacetum cinerariifolium]
MSLQVKFVHQSSFLRRGNQCSKSGNLGHNRKGCKDQYKELVQGMPSVKLLVVGARNVFSQAIGSSKQIQAPRQAASVKNASIQAGRSSQQSQGPIQGAGARNAFSQAVGSSQPSAAPSQAS